MLDRTRELPSISSVIQYESLIGVCNIVDYWKAQQLRVAHSKAQSITGYSILQSQIMTATSHPVQTHRVPNGINDTTHLMNGHGIIRPKRDAGRLAIVASTIADIIVFLATSIGFILQEFYYRIVGHPEKDLRGEVALVTGGGGGLGRLLAYRLGKLGVYVVVWDINQSGIDETVELLRANGAKCIGYRVDISKKEEVYQAADSIRKDVGNVTLLINNAGVVSGRAFLDTPDHLIERSFNVNILAHFWTTKAFLPAMLEHDHGHIVTIASLAGHVGMSKLVDYCSSKFAAVGFDEALRLELAALGTQDVSTTCICPFFIQATGMFDDVDSRWVPTLTSENVADRIVRAIQKKEKLVVMPSYLQFMLCIKWIFPWGCTAGFLKRIVPDAAPQHGLLNGTPLMQKTTVVQSAGEDMANGGEQTTLLGNDTRSTSNNNNNSNNTNNNNNTSKAASMLMKQSPFIGERVL